MNVQAYGVRAAEPQKVIAVTGGAGFLGSHLCKKLHAQGHRIVCLDNLHTGRKENVGRLQKSDRFTFIEHDIVNPLPEGFRFDEIYNLACPASPVHYQQDRVKTALICAQGAFNVLERAARDGARIFHASTSEIYGDPEVHPQTETYCGNVNPVGPRSCYDEGKRFAETLLTDYTRQHGLTLRLARIFNTYGPWMQPDDGRVVSSFIIQALRGESITVYGDGTQTRSFCYVSDLIEGFLRLMNAGDEAAGPMNLGNPVEITVGALAELIVEKTNSNSRIIYLPLPVDDPRKRRPDISRATAQLGWSPEVSLDEGLDRTIDYFDSHLSDLPSVGLQMAI